MNVIKININRLALQDPLKICLVNDDFYKKCSRYIGHLTTQITLFYQTLGYRQASVESSLTKATILFNKEKKWIRITNVLPVEMVKSSIAWVTFEVEEQDVVSAQALLKKLKVPRNAVG